MKTPVRGKYLVREHDVELRRIIPARSIVADGVGFSATGGVQGAACYPADADRSRDTA